MTAPTYPQYPAGYPAPQQPSYPQQPAAWPQPPAPAYPGQQYAPGYPPVQSAGPVQPLAAGTIDDFYNQPSAGGGKSLSFKVIGERHIGVVTRAIGAGDVQQQTDTMGRPQFFRDGRPKFVMKVPLQMQPSPEHPDGLGTWFVKGQARDELVRAMAEAGAPAGPPEAGAVVDITYVADRAAGQGMNPAKQFRVIYTRPNGAPPAAAAPQYAQQQQQQQQPAASSAPQAPVQQPQPPVPAQQYPQAPPVPQAPVQPPAQAPQMPAAPSDLTPEQQALLAKLTGGAPAA